MSESKKIEVCEYCSGFDVTELKGKVKAKIGCIGKCSRKFPELSDKIYGFLNGEFIVCDTKEEFFTKIEQLDNYTPINSMNPKVDAFLSTVPKYREEMIKLRQIVLDCQLAEELKWGQPCYMVNNSNVIMIGYFKDCCLLSFVKGALLKDSNHILMQLTKNVQASRLIKFKNIAEIEALETILKAYIHEAIEVEKSGLKVNYKKSTDFEIPNELQSKFDQMPAFKDAFYALTAGRQRGYILYFSSAKQSKTRESRIVKSMDRIFDGMGLDD